MIDGIFWLELSGCWASFYSHVRQYHVASVVAFGICHRSLLLFVLQHYLKLSQTCAILCMC